MVAILKEQEAYLMEITIGGSEDTFATIVQTYQARIYKSALEIVHDRDDAFDICQQVFYSAWKSLRTFRGESSLLTWLISIMRHEAYTFLADSKKRTLSAEAWWQGVIFEESRIPFTANEEDLVSLVYDQILSLPLKYQSVIRAYYLAGITLREIVDSDSMGYEAVKSRLRRGISLLRDRVYSALASDKSQVSVHLTSGEMRVLVALSLGKSNKDIAIDLSISHATVVTYLTKITSKFAQAFPGSDIQRTSIVLLARRCGLLPEDIRTVSPDLLKVPSAPEFPWRGRLTPRQLQVVECICLGDSNYIIAKKLGISLKTVESHITCVLGITNSLSRWELASWWSAERWAYRHLPGNFPGWSAYFPGWSAEKWVCRGWSRKLR